MLLHAVLYIDRNINMTSMVSGKSVTFRSRFLEVGRIMSAWAWGTVVIEVFGCPSTPTKKSRGPDKASEPQGRRAQRCRVGTVGETLFVRQTYIQCGLQNCCS